MIKAGVIGTGGISGVHLSFITSRDDIELLGLCDIKPEALKRRQDQFGGKGYDHFMKLLDGAQPNTIWLCTPPDVREEMLVECAKRGIAVFCEKPVERSEEKAESIAAQLRKLNAKVQIGYVFRALPCVEKLKELMADDTIYLVQSFYGCNMSITRTMPEWFYDKEKSGGGLIDQATHNLDLLRYMLGEIIEVVGTVSNPRTKKEPGYTIDETIGLSFVFENGILGTHTHTWVGDAWRNELNFSGEKRHYRIDMWKGEITVFEGSGRRIIDANEGTMYTHENELFADRVNSGDWSENICDYDDGLRTLKLTLAADRSITEGKRKIA